MLLTGEHLRALDALRASEAAGQAARAIDEAELDTYRVLDLQGLARPDLGQAYLLTFEGREALRLLEEMRAQGRLLPADRIERDWRFLGSEVLAALAAAGRAGGRVGPLAEELLRERGLADTIRDRERKVSYPALTPHGTAWLEFAERHRPRLEITRELASTVRNMLPAYVNPHELRVPAAHRAQLEAMRLLVWSVPNGDVFTFTAVGRAVYEALQKGGFPIADVVLDDGILTKLANEADNGADAPSPEQLAELQALGYVDADGGLTPGGEAALRARRLLGEQPARPPATITLTRHEAELLSEAHELSQSHFDPKTLTTKPPQPVTKHTLHRVFVEGLERRYQAFVGKYGRKVREVEARKRQEEEMLAELRDRDRAFGSPDVLDELLVHLESFELLRREADGRTTVFRLTPNGLQVVREQGKSPRAITSPAVKAVTITTMAGHHYAPAAPWISLAREEELIGPGGITKAGDFYAWLAEHATRWPALSRQEAQTLLNLPGTEVTVEDHEDQDERRARRGAGEDERELSHTLDRLEARGLIELLVDGQIVRTEAGDLLRRAVAGAMELAYPVTPAIVRLLVAIRQVGKSLYVKEDKVRMPPEQWDEVERLAGLGPDEFRETVHLAKLGDYIGDAGLRESGRDVLEALAKVNLAA